MMLTRSRIRINQKKEILTRKTVEEGEPTKTKRIKREPEREKDQNLKEKTQEDSRIIKKKEWKIRMIADFRLTGSKKC